MAKAINKYWNNGGNGWTVELQDGTEYTLLFTPEIRAVTNNAYDDAGKAQGFEDYDRMHHRSAISPLEASHVNHVKSWTAGKNYPLPTADDTLLVPPQPWSRHVGVIVAEEAQKKTYPWRLAHEYGHLLGMVHRYNDQDLQKASHIGHEKDVMGGADATGSSAPPSTIMEFLELSGVKVKSVKPRSGAPGVAPWLSGWEQGGKALQGLTVTEDDWKGNRPWGANEATKDVLKPVKDWKDMMVIPK